MERRLVPLTWRSALHRGFNPKMLGRAARAMLLDRSLAAHACDLIVLGMPVRLLQSLWRSGRKRLFWDIASGAVLIQAVAFANKIYWSQ